MNPPPQAVISDPVPVTSGPEQPIESLPEAEVLSFQGHQSPDRGEANNFCNDSRVPLAFVFSLSLAHTHMHTHTHNLTSDLFINTPEHPILLSQAIARFSSLHLLFSFIPFLLFFLK